MEDFAISPPRSALDRNTDSICVQGAPRGVSHFKCKIDTRPMIPRGQKHVPEPDKAGKTMLSRACVFGQHCCCCCPLSWPICSTYMLQAFVLLAVNTTYVQQCCKSVTSILLSFLSARQLISENHLIYGQSDDFLHTSSVA